jgi:hypothetical protein
LVSINQVDQEFSLFEKIKREKRYILKNSPNNLIVFLFQKIKGILKNGHFWNVQKKGGGGFSLQKIRRDHKKFLCSGYF